MPNYVASGAGDSSYNGTFADQGGGVWYNAAGATYLWDDGYGSLYLSPGVGMFPPAYWATGPDPATTWYVAAGVEPAPTVVAAPGGHTVSGTVTEGQTGAAGVTVTAVKGATTKTASTALDGSYAFTDCEDGIWTVTPSGHGGSFTPASREVVVSGADVTGQDFSGSFSSDWLSGWGYRSKLMVDPARVGDELTDFPLLLTGANVPAGLWAEVLADGRDLRVTAEDGTTVLKSELVRLDAEGQTLELWFKAPALSPTAGGWFYLYWGKADAEAPPAADRQAVWSNGFAAVWHLHQPAGNADSTGHGNDATVWTPAPSAEAGAIGGAAGFDGSSGQGLTLPSNSSLSLATMTLSGWAKVAASDPSGWRMLLEHGRGTANNYGVFRNAYGPQFGFRWSPSAYLTFTRSYTPGAWCHVAGTFGDGTATTYLNGAQDGQTTGSAPTPVDAGGSLGNNSAGEQFAGLLDEWRVSSVARSGGWLATEYQNQNAPASFVASGTPETAGGGLEEGAAACAAEASVAGSLRRLRPGISGAEVGAAGGGWGGRTRLGSSQEIAATAVSTTATAWYAGAAGAQVDTGVRAAGLAQAVAQVAAAMVAAVTGLAGRALTGAADAGGSAGALSGGRRLRQGATQGEALAESGSRGGRLRGAEVASGTQSAIVVVARALRHGAAAVGAVARASSAGRLLQGMRAVRQVLWASGRLARQRLRGTARVARQVWPAAGRLAPQRWQAQARGGSNMEYLGTKEKTPEEVVPRRWSVDFGPNLVLGETLSEARITVRDRETREDVTAAMVAGAPVIEGTAVTATFQGGGSGRTYAVTVGVTTSLGAVSEEVFLIAVRVPQGSG